MESFSIGTGASIYTQSFLPAILSAKHEIILVTCYWARSKTLTGICNVLEQLAHRRATQQPTDILRVRVCFSSRSLFQKLFHTSSSEGYIYPPSTWVAKLGLPSPEVLEAGKIDLRVKSLFYLPFSVMHPKFLVVDRCRAFVPSCNVSWEAWLECCLELARREAHGDPIDGLLDFYRGVWDKTLCLDGDMSFSQLPQAHDEDLPLRVETGIIRSPADITVKLSGFGVPPAAIEWLPSWHHRNPRFCLFPWQIPKAPETPLNTTLLRLFAEASRDVFIHTPNITAPPVLSAIIDTLARGVDVNIVTSRKMMVWEQVLTAGTTAERCIKNLTRTYSRLCESVRNRRGRLCQSEGGGTADTADLEEMIITPGSLKISYFQSLGLAVEEQPVHSHVKLTIFDGECTVLGSGNMDRASWFTSQELGILVRNDAFAAAIKSTVSKALEGRLDHVFPTTH